MSNATQLGERTFNKAVHMRSVRCDVCGTKALMAASQCPKCSHLFEVRDGFGELLPLAYCSMCESYYPASVGSCRWCGTKPEPAPKAPLMWKRIGVGGLVAVAWLGWLLRDPQPKPSAHAKTTAQPKPESTYVADTAPSVPTLAPVGPRDTVAPRATTVSTGNVDRTPAAAPSTPITGAIDPVVPQAAPRAPATATAPSRPASRWVNSVAKSWTIVRADARRDARIVASIGPDSRVQLGESRDGWRRIRSRNISGWVDEGRSSFAAARGSAKATGFAVR
jgi:hypothetical protein